MYPELVCSGLAWISLRYADHQSLNELDAETRAGNRSEDHPLKVLTGLSIQKRWPSDPCSYILSPLCTILLPPQITSD